MVRSYPGPVATVADQNDSILKKMDRVHVQGSYFERDNQLFLSLSPLDRKYRGELFANISAKSYVALLTRVDPRADACMVWIHGSDRKHAISQPHGSGGRMTGNFILFIAPSDQSVDDVTPIEDGYVVRLTKNAWQRMRDALIAGTDVVIPGSKPEEASIAIDWRLDSYKSPVTGQTYWTPDGWWDLTPEIIFEPKRAGPLTFTSGILFLTPEPTFDTRTGNSFVAYNDTIHDGLEAFFNPPEHRINRDFALRFEFAPGKKVKIGIATRPPVDTDQQLMRDLYNLLISVPSPVVATPIVMEYQFTVSANARAV